MHKFRVGINPGHGGRSNGTTANGIIEKNEVLLIGQELGHKLECQPDIEVTLLRNGDEYLSLPGRVRRARVARCELVICLHINANKNPAAHGAEVYYHHGNQRSKDIARACANYFPSKLRTGKIIDAYNDPDKTNDDWLQKPENVLDEFPLAILPEIFYASNESDLAYYRTNEGRCEIIDALFKTTLYASEMIRNRQCLEA